MELMMRQMEARDAEAVLDMMRAFYASPAVHSDGSEDIFHADIAACLAPGVPLTGYVFTLEDRPVGYAMTAESFSTEYGRPCLWIEELYFLPEARGTGAGTRFLQWLATQRPDAVLRLEAEDENERAVHVYRKCGFETVPYLELWKR